MSFKDNIARLLQTIENDPNFDVEEIQELIMDTSDDEIKTSFVQFINLCHVLTDALVKTQRSVSGINLIGTAIYKIQAHGSQLTPIHSDFCLLCLESKCLNPALRFLEADYTEIKKTDEKDEDIKQVLLYYYYGGLIYTAIKNFEKASYFFEIVLTVPANVVNVVMQETYKKQIIINLILHGKLPENMLPKFTPACVLRLKKQVTQSYLKLAHEYSSLSHDKIERLIKSNKETYERDENMGLLMQCLTLVNRRNIQRLTKTFLTLSLRDVANHVGLATEKEAELYILNMIDDGEIFATINQKDGMVVFEDNPEKFDSVRVFQRIQDDMSTCINLINIFKKLETSAEPKVSTRVALGSDLQ